jgi:2-polyprenyl-6-methoxyphenol hydroxylase-like FAD-dependent oxidoreductase
MRENVLVVGAGIAGLFTALAIAPTGRKVTILERDSAPQSHDTDDAFLNWQRRGVGHLRQSHAFLARLRSIIRTEHPGLLDELLSLGVRELNFESMLSEMQRKNYVPLPGDAELAIITSRRTTLELALRRYVERLANVEIVSDAAARGLLTESANPIRVVGVSADVAGERRELRADVVVDAGGKNSTLVEQLAAAGMRLHEESETAGILYFTRHYRLKPGRSEPSRIGNPPAGGDLGFLKFGIFPADNGCFSVTLCTPEIEYELRKGIVDPDTFHAITQILPGLRVWTNEEQAVPTSKVFGMGDLNSRWRDLVVDGKPSVLGFFSLGDALIRTNPLYGRGCSIAAVSAYMLRDVLDGAADPAARLLAYHARLHEEIRPYYLTMRGQDRSAMKRARQTLTPGAKPSLRDRMLRSFIEDGVVVATRFDIDLLRESMRGFHMFEHPNRWLTQPKNIARILRYWSRGKKKNAAAYPPKPGPERAEMLRALSIDPERDMLGGSEMKKAA